MRTQSQRLPGLISIRLRYGRLRAVEKPGTQNASVPEGHSTKRKTYLEFPTYYGMWNCSDSFQDERKVRKASIASIVCLVLPCHLYRESESLGG
jgi:hypothetical protein